MGKRKTRKRSRRSKKGGLGKQFGKSLLIWYGAKNEGKTTKTVQSVKYINRNIGNNNINNNIGNRGNTTPT